MAAKLAEVCPVDIYAVGEGGELRIVEENLDECVLCRLCIDAAPQGTVTVQEALRRRRRAALGMPELPEAERARQQIERVARPRDRRGRRHRHLRLPPARAGRDRGGAGRPAADRRAPAREVPLGGDRRRRARSRAPPRDGRADHGRRGAGAQPLGPLRARVRRRRADGAARQAPARAGGDRARLLARRPRCGRGEPRHVPRARRQGDARPEGQAARPGRDRRRREPARRRDALARAALPAARRRASSPSRSSTRCGASCAPPPATRSARAASTRAASCRPAAAAGPARAAAPASTARRSAAAPRTGARAANQIVDTDYLVLNTPTRWLPVASATSSRWPRCRTSHASRCTPTSSGRRCARTATSAASSSTTARCTWSSSSSRRPGFVAAQETDASGPASRAHRLRDHRRRPGRAARLAARAGRGAAARVPALRRRALADRRAARPSEVRRPCCGSGSSRLAAQRAEIRGLIDHTLAQACHRCSSSRRSTGSPCSTPSPRSSRVHRADHRPTGRVGPAVGPVPPRGEPVTPPRNALIIGGGIAGAATAMALHKAGIEPVVFEARPSPTDEARSSRSARTGSRRSDCSEPAISRSPSASRRRR